MLLPALSIAALAVGPLSLRLLGKRRGPIAWLDGFVLVALVGLVALHVLPHSIELAGPWAAAAALTGFVLPPLLERGLSRRPKSLDAGLSALALAGLAVHALLDGVALTGAEHHADAHAELLALSVLLHRVPLGLTIWWVVRPERGLAAALAAIGVIATATVGGVWGGGAVLAQLPLAALGVFQALVAGTLLHVVMEHPPPVLRIADPASRRFGAVGAIMAAIALVALTHDHAVHELEAAIGAGETFFALALSVAPALLAALALTALIHALLPRAPISWLAAGGSLRRAAKGMVFGVPLPISACGVLPEYRRLVRRGAPAAAAVAFLAAMPGIGVDALLVSIPLLGIELALLRVACAMAVALVVGLLVALLPASTAQPKPASRGEDPERGPGGAAAGVRFAFTELVDHVGPWLLLGLGAAALIEPLAGNDWLAALPPGIDVVVAAVVGLPSYMSAAGAMPLVTVLTHKGLSPGAALAFLVTGPAANLAAAVVLAKLHSPRVAAWFLGAVVAVAALAGWLANPLLDAGALLDVHAAAAQTPSMLQLACAAVLALLLLISLLRQGPRGVLGQIFDPHVEHSGHGHDHVHAVGHHHH